MNRRSRSLLIASLTLGLVMFGCTNSADEPSPTPTVATPPEATATSTAQPATPEPTPGVGTPVEARRTGSPFLDEIIEAVDTRDAPALAALVEYTEIGCTHADGMGGPPKCDPHQAEGDIVRVLPGAECHGYWSDRGAQMLATLAHRTDGLYAVVSVAGGASLGGEWPEADTLLVFHADWFGSPAGLRLHVADGRIVATWAGCGAVTPESLLTQGIEGDVATIAGPWDEPRRIAVEVPVTGVPAVDAVVAAVATYDVIALIESTERAMQDLPPVECVAELNFPGGVECDADKGEEPSDPVSVFPVAYCEGVLVREPAPAIRAFLDQAPVLHSVLEPPAEPSRSDLYRHGAYWLVYEFTGEERQLVEAARLHVTAEGDVTLVWYGCMPALREIVTWEGAPLSRIPFEVQVREE